VEELRSAPLAPPGPGDHVRGPRDMPLVVMYGDFACPHCAVLHAQLLDRDDRVSVCFRHFPVKTRRPRGWFAACAAEAAGAQGAFWEMCDLLFADPARLEDPHLWDRAGRLGLDVERFEADRRSEPVAARVRGDFTGGVRAGVVATPTAFLAGEAFGEVRTWELLERLGPRGSEGPGR
jgi:protein-disulfide isomerase